MDHVSFTLVADGSSDSILIPIIEWLLDQIAPDMSYRIEMAANIGAHSHGLNSRIKNAVKLFPCDFLIVHRDSENESHADRVTEIHTACEQGTAIVVPIIPVRMSEAWLLGNESAIRQAADNPNGKPKLNLPAKNHWEGEPDPKKVLFDALLTASEKTGRRLRSFKPEQRRHRVAQLIDDYSYLRGLSSFDSFEHAFSTAIKTAPSNHRT